MVPSHPRILLIDDDPDLHEVVRMVLNPQGYEVQCCSVAAEGFALARKGRFDLLILDVMLASPTEGLELADRLSGDPATRDVPILMISAINEAMGRDYAEQAGLSRIPAESFLEKPFDAATLSRTVARILSAANSQESQ